MSSAAALSIISMDVASIDVVDTINGLVFHEFILIVE